MNETYARMVNAYTKATSIHSKSDINDLLLAEHFALMIPQLAEELAEELKAEIYMRMKGKCNG